jgi:type VI secretion system secreted protein VgrG
MSGFSQNNSPLRLHTPLPENTLLPVRLSAREKLGEPFSFLVEMVSSKGAVIPFDQLIGHSASVAATLPGAVERHFHGEIWSFSSGISDAIFDHHTLELRPRLSKLGLARRSRVFQEKTAVEILTILAREAGEDVTSHLRWAQPVRLCCTQYRETDLEFFFRLCSESGIVAYWVHTASDHCLFLTDSTSHYHKELGFIPYDTTKGARSELPRADSWRLTQQRLSLIHI